MILNQNGVELDQQKHWDIDIVISHVPFLSAFRIRDRTRVDVKLTCGSISRENDRISTSRRYNSPLWTF